METNVNYTLAGTFVIALLTAIIFGIIWLSAGITGGVYTIYEVYMTESVSGLSIDGPVEFNGVNVGTVSAIKISHKNPKLVELFLKIKSETPVTVATRAKFAVRALTGVGYILLEDKGTDKRALIIQPNQEYPVIETVPSILVRLETLLTDLSDSFKSFSHSVQSLLDKENLDSIKQLLKATHATFHLLEERTIPLANQTISTLEGVSRDLSVITSEIKDNPAVLIRGKTPSQKLGPGEQ